jgi:polyprenyl-phospho-N-acetylgalactosaminyl synthase
MPKLEERSAPATKHAGKPANVASSAPERRPDVVDSMRNATRVIIPARNESQKISATVGEVRAKGWPVIVVDDGSTDDTSDLARNAGALVLRHPFNLGQGAALQTGIAAALRDDARFLVTFDADGQHSAADIESLIQPLIENYDVALGSRFLGRTEGAGPGRRLLLRISVFASNRISGMQLSDAHCGLRAFTALAARDLEITQNGMAHASEILSHLRRRKLRITEVPVTVTYTDYSLNKGQGSIQALRILFDLFFRTG